MNTNNAYAGCSNRISIVLRTLFLPSLAVVAIWQGAVAADARPFLETGLPVFTNDNAARRHYRLPSLLVTGKGTVIAVSQLRRGPDDFAPQELVCRRSEDGGKTWGPEISIRRDAERKHCMFNGCIVEDAETGKLILHFLEFPASQGPQWFPNVFFSRGGGHCQTESTDDGKTWSDPILQIPVANADGWKGASSLNNNHGVQLQHGPHRGRLVMNARVFKPDVTTWRAKGGIVYSDDHGRTWRIGGVPFPDRDRYATESCLVETAGGGIYVNYRSEVGGENQPRLYHRSKDGGTTVSEQGQHEDLPPMVCNAGMTRYSWTPRSIILLTMPATAGQRDSTCFASYDEGRTWRVQRRITPDGGYSDVAVLSDSTILVAYEPDGARKGVALARFNLAWLLNKER
jgi:sialidase-1